MSKYFEQKSGAASDGDGATPGIMMNGIFCTKFGLDDVAEQPGRTTRTIETA